MRLEVSATLKENGIPCILADGVHYSGCDYLTKMHKRKLTLTESDREMLFDNYNISYYKIESYVVFRSDKKIFADYIKPLYEHKRTLPKGMERDFVKSMLVGFIGTFARKVYTSDYDFVEKDGCLIAQKISKTANEIEKEYKRLDGMCFLNAAIVSASRQYIVSFIKRHMDRFLYTDTDSIHLSGQDIPSDIPISDKMGDFKVEHTFTKCEYRDIKKYMIVENGVIIPTIAGIPKDSFETIVKVPGIDTKKISKYITHKDLHHLFLSPIAISQLQEDIETGTCEYVSRAVKLSGEDMRSKISKKISEYRRKREGWDYCNGKAIDANLKRRYGAHAVLEHAISKWAYGVKDGSIKPSFDKCVEFLRAEKAKYSL